MSIISELLNIFTSSFFYFFVWISLVILTFFLLRNILNDYVQRRRLNNALNLFESTKEKTSLAEIQFYLEREGHYLDKQFMKGRSDFVDKNSENSPLFLKILDQIDSKSISKEFVILIANEMKRVRERNENLTQFLSKEVNAFLNNPENWVERFFQEPKDPKEMETQHESIKTMLFDYLVEFSSTMKIPELRNNIERR